MSVYDYTMRLGISTEDFTWAILWMEERDGEFYEETKSRVDKHIEEYGIEIGVVEHVFKKTCPYCKCKQDVVNKDFLYSWEDHQGRVLVYGIVCDLCDNKFSVKSGKVLKNKPANKG